MTHRLPRTVLTVAAAAVFALVSPSYPLVATAAPCTGGTITILNGSTGAVVKVINVPSTFGSESIHGDFIGPNGTIIDVDICANSAPLPTPIPGTRPQALVFITPAPTPRSTAVPLATAVPPAPSATAQTSAAAAPRTLATPSSSAPGAVAPAGVFIQPPNTGDGGLRSRIAFSEDAR